MNQRLPTVSVLMSAYNCGPFVEEAVSSILNQTFTDFEFLIVDDLSTDDTWARLSAVRDSRIVLEQSESNSGPAESKNRLLAKASGEFIAIMDADDSCLPHRFALQLRHLREHPDCGAVGSSFLLMDSAGRDLALRTPPAEDAEIRAGLRLRRNTIMHPSSMIRASVLKSLGGYWARLPSAIDYDLFLRLKDVSGLANIPQALYRYRHHAQQISSTRLREQASLSLLIDYFQMERELFGRDSRDDVTDEHLLLARQGALPLVGSYSKAQELRLLGALVRLLSRGTWTSQAVQVARLMIRQNRLHPSGYLALLQVLTSPRACIRPLKRAKNIVGRTVYRALGAGSGGGE